MAIHLAVALVLASNFDCSIGFAFLSTPVSVDLEKACNWQMSSIDPQTKWVFAMQMICKSVSCGHLF